jgi:hypothetical protein
LGLTTEEGDNVAAEDIGERYRRREARKRDAAGLDQADRRARNPRQGSQLLLRKAAS